MFIPSFKDVQEISDSPYKLSLMVAARARQINEGAEPFIETTDNNSVTIAFKEVIAGDIIEDKES